MIKVSNPAKKVMDQLTQGLEAPGAHRKIDNSPGFMAVHIENVGSCELGPMFSVAHYYEQNGDLMKDPDMVFIRSQDGDYYPIEFQQDNLALYQCAVEFDQGEIRRVNNKLQNDLANFANSWMKNIREQQGLNGEGKG